MQSSRKLSSKEAKLMSILVLKSKIELSSDWKEKLIVKPMDDGGMGSLKLYPTGDLYENRKFGEKVSEIQFLDKDGVLVSASLNIDDKGKLYELDMWKVDFTSLIEIPEM